MTLRQEHKSLYWAWKSMKQRCQNPKCVVYRNYGQRGISVCDEWQKFEPFLEWALNNGFQKGLDLDRKNNDGNYEPSNCRWVARRENINNRRNTIKITVDGETLPDTLWAEKVGVNRAVLTGWVRNHGHEYASYRIKDILENGYTPKDYGYSHRRPVRHVESGEVFVSLKETAKHFDVPPNRISISIKTGIPTENGSFVWEELDAEGNVIGGNYHEYMD